MTRDFVAGLACLAVSIVLLAATRGLPEASMLVPIGPGAYPRVVLVITAALSLWIVIDGWRTRRTGRAERHDAARSAGEKKNYGLVLAAFATFGLYTLLLPYLGFRLATLGFVGALQALLDPPRTLRAWLTLISVAVVTAFGAHLVFERSLGILLPRGRWTDS